MSDLITRPRVSDLIGIEMSRRGVCCGFYVSLQIAELQELCGKGDANSFIAFIAPFQTPEAGFALI